VLKRPDIKKLNQLILQMPPVSVFQGGKGEGRGQLDFPRGITVDRSGNILVADSSNNRVQKFAATGAFLSMFGAQGRFPGEFQEPNGIAVDSKGNIYVADVSNHRVQKFTSDGRITTQWSGPAPGFYGPRDIWITPDDFVYVVDQGRSRVVKLDTNGTVLATWGSQGAGDEQFDEPTAVAVDPKRQRVYVADPHHRRIQVFDTTGKFLSKWQVDSWQATGWSFQDLWFDPQTDRLYATSPTTDEVLVFDPEGTRLQALQPKPPNKLEGPSGLAVFHGKVYVLCAFSDRVTTIDLPPK
jgi:DNA-binding beta-propeller fold protein YncE